MNFTKILSLSLSLFFSVMSFSQETDLGAVSGNFQIISQYYNSDTLINAILPDHKMGLNSFANVNYNKGNFSAGIRYESYLNPIEGYPTSFNGTGLGYRYANWKNKSLDVTIGNFYEQYGSGLILRAYEERNLGVFTTQKTLEPMSTLLRKALPIPGIYSFSGQSLCRNPVHPIVEVIAKSLLAFVFAWMSLMIGPESSLDGCSCEALKRASLIATALTKISGSCQGSLPRLKCV